MGIKIVLSCFIYTSPCPCFLYAQWSIFKYIKKTKSRLSRLYPLLFAFKILMVSQLRDL